MDRAGNGLSVSEAAAFVGLTAHTLRWYEQEGLVAAVDRDSAGRRRYREPDLDWLRLLIRLRTTGMPIREMRRYAELVRRGDATVGERLRMFLEHRERVVARIAELRRDLAAIDTKIEIYRKREREHDEVTTAG
jgi:DNA-binding transcriptional MerR regulator